MSSQNPTAATIHLPYAPALPGLYFRTFRGPVDYPLMAALIAASRAADGIDSLLTAEDLARFYESRANFDRDRDLLLAEVGGELVGYTRVFHDVDTDGTQLYAHMAHVRPEWRGRGLGGALLRFSETRLQEIAAAQPEVGQRVLETWVADTQQDKEWLVRQAGYEAARHNYQMVCLLQETVAPVSLPPNLALRAVTPDQYQALVAALNDAFQDHWSFVPQSQQEFEALMLGSDHDPDLWLVAWEENEIAGMVLSHIRTQDNRAYNRQRGWVYWVCVRRPWRKRGLALALLTLSLRALQARGMTEAVLNVDTENLTGALRLYERAGFRAAKRFSTYRKPLDHSHAAGAEMGRDGEQSREG